MACWNAPARGPLGSRLDGSLGRCGGESRVVAGAGGAGVGSDAAGAGASASGALFATSAKSQSTKLESSDSSVLC